MIASIIGTGSFLDASGKPTPKLIVRLEMLTVTDSWRTIAQSQTNEKGEVKMKAAGGELRELTVVPTTRLVDERGNMLTENPVVTVSRNELTLDFGETVRGLSTSVLGTRAIIPTLATGNLKINKDTVLQPTSGVSAASDDKLIQSVKLENETLLKRVNLSDQETKALKAENNMLMQRVSEVDQQSRNLKLEQESLLKRTNLADQEAKALKAENTMLLQRINEVDQQSQNLKLTQENLLKQNNLTIQETTTLRNENKQLLQRANEADQQQNTLKVENIRLTKNVDEADKKVTELKQVNQTLQKEVVLAKQNSDVLKKTELDLQGKITEQELKINLLNSQLDNLKKPITNDLLDKAATTEFSRLKLETLGTKIELQESAAQTKILTDNLKGLTVERDKLVLELNELRTAEKAAPRIDTLASTIANSLQGVEAQGVELVDARITIKGYLAGGGDQFKPLDAAELSRINPGLASEISFGVRPKPALNPETGQKMPDVVGLTPASASRILRPLGNKVEVITISGIPVGAIISQHPIAGASLPLDSTIRLMVATA